MTGFFIMKPKTIQTTMSNMKEVCTKNPKNLRITTSSLTNFFKQNPKTFQTPMFNLTRFCSKKSRY